MAEDKPEIEKHRILHELQAKFDVPDAFKSTLESQLSENDQKRIGRFIAGFKIEDWFEWTFSVMPWVRLIHGLDQQQFPSRSKSEYQVPDFLMLIETSELTVQPLVVEVKRVSGDKTTLKVSKSQIELCQVYTDTIRLPLVYAIYWEKFYTWTLNTPDVFEGKSATSKLGIAAAIEYDCGAILGDISYLISPTLTREVQFDLSVISEDSIRHKKYGTLLSDAVTLDGKRVELTPVETAAIDAMLSMSTVERRRDGDKTTLLERLDDVYLLKLSASITRHLAMIGLQPTDESSNMSVHVITEVMDKLDCSIIHMFPTDGSPQLKILDRMFRGKSTDK